MTTLIQQTSSLTRPTDVLKYYIDNNRNRGLDNETVIIQFTVEGNNFANDGLTRRILASDTKDREGYKNPSGAFSFYYPNGTDSATVAQSSSANAPVANISYVGAYYSQHKSPYAAAYDNGILANTGSGDWINPAWGTYFYIASNNGGISQINGIIQKIMIFNRVLTANEILTIVTWMKAN
jgi:hypothetical protein